MYNKAMINIEGAKHHEIVRGSAVEISIKP